MVLGLPTVKTRSGETVVSGGSASHTRIHQSVDIPACQQPLGSRVQELTLPDPASSSNASRYSRHVQLESMVFGL